ncbi:MAG: hypothetical protein ABIL70_01235 [candidate division WOR-3 bacterium]
MLNFTKTFVIVLIIVPILISAHDMSLHMYIGSQTFDVWQEFDPEFYNALVSAQAGWQSTPTTDYSKLMLLKFYYIGLTLPDLFKGEGGQIFIFYIDKQS